MIYFTIQNMQSNKAHLNIHREIVYVFVDEILKDMKHEPCYVFLSWKNSWFGVKKNELWRMFFSIG